MRSKLSTSAISRPRVIVPLQLLVALTIYALVLYYTYKLKVAPQYSYMGLTFREPETFSYAVAIGLTLIVALVLPRSISRVSDFILWVLFVLGVAPSILIAQYSTTLPPDEALRMAIAIAFTTLMVIVLTSMGPRNIAVFKRLEKGIDFWVVLLVFSVIVYALLIATAGLSFRYLSFADVYDVRSDFGVAASGSLAAGYLLPVQLNVVNPLFVIKGILSRRLAPLLMGVGGQVLAYSTTGRKSALFSLAAILGIALLYRAYKERAVPGASILLAVTGASMFAIVVDQISGGVTWTSLISRRIMIIPGVLVSAYVSVFQDRPWQMFAEVIPWVTNPYLETRPVNIVGEFFVGDSATAANVNLFGHGYLQMGYPGMFVEGAVLAVLLILANAATRDLPLVVSCVAFFGATLALVSASVFTTALTNGFLATILICWIAPARTWQRHLADSPRAGRLAAGRLGA